MAIRYLLSGGNFATAFGTNVNIPGLTTSLFGTFTNATPASTPGDGWALFFGGNGPSIVTTNIGINASTIYVGYRAYIQTSLNNSNLIQLRDGAGLQQCNLVLNTSGQVYFTGPAGNTISSPSTIAVSLNTWNYFEFKAVLSSGGGGTCEAAINGAVVLTATGLTNASISGGHIFGATVALAQFSLAVAPGYIRDFYILDGLSGVNTSYLGDVIVQEVYPNGAGVNAQSPTNWPNNVGPFSITSVANGTGVYTGVVTGGISNAYAGYYFVATAFAQAANNGTFLCTASTTTTLTLANALSVADTTGSCAFQAIVQPGIGQIGTRPNNDATYISDTTSGHVVDFTHTTFSSPSSVIAAVSHLTYAKKDDVGVRQIQQATLLGPTTALQTATLGTTYQYYQQLFDTDPNSNPWSIVNYNNTTFGVRELT